jgi:arylsulfatase A-like enzyme
MRETREMDNTSSKFSAVSRRRFIAGLGGAAALAGTGFPSFGGLSRAPRSRPKNFVIIMTDQQHFDTIAGAGCPHVVTPAMDRLRASGMSFNISYCANPVCSPARSAILTGRTSSETGVYTNGLPICAGIPNVAEWFSTHTDCETVYSGKWHVPEPSSLEIPGFKVISTMRNLQGNASDPCIARACEGYIRNRSADKPFLMVASFQQPHDIHGWVNHNWVEPDVPRFPELDSQLPELPANFEPGQEEPALLKRVRKTDPKGGPGSWSERHWRYYLWSYYRQVEMVDAEIGRVMDALDEAGIAGETMIIFTSDHGEGLGHHRMVFKNFLYDAAVKVPLIVSWPGGLPGGTVETDHPVCGYDIMPTICDCAGISLPPGTVGTSLKPLLEGTAEGFRDHIVSELVLNEGRMVRTRKYKYIVYRNDPVELLFDMDADPGETVNLARKPAHDSVLWRHRSLLVEWEKRLTPAPDTPNRDDWTRTVENWSASMADKSAALSLERAAGRGGKS